MYAIAVAKTKLFRDSLTGSGKQYLWRRMYINPITHTNLEETSYYKGVVLHALCIHIANYYMQFIAFNVHVHFTSTCIEF